MQCIGIIYIFLRNKLVLPSISHYQSFRISDHYLALQSYLEHHSLLVFCTSFKFDCHYARSRPLLLALIFLACLLTLKFEALTLMSAIMNAMQKQASIGRFAQISDRKKKEKKIEREVLRIGEPITQFKGTFLLHLGLQHKLF